MTVYEDVYEYVGCISRLLSEGTNRKLAVTGSFKGTAIKIATKITNTTSTNSMLDMSTRQDESKIGINIYDETMQRSDKTLSRFDNHHQSLPHVHPENIYLLPTASDSLVKLVREWMPDFVRTVTSSNNV